VVRTYPRRCGTRGDAAAYAAATRWSRV